MKVTPAALDAGPVLHVRVDETVREPHAREALLCGVRALQWDACQQVVETHPVDGTIEVYGLGMSIPESATRVTRDEQGIVWQTARHWWIQRATYGVALSRASTQAAVYVNDAAEDKQAALAYAFRDVVTLLLPRTGWMPLHAACVVPADMPQEGVLLVGASGTGKSTLTLGMLMQGARCVSDDLLLVEQEKTCTGNHTCPQGVAVHSMMRDIRVCNDAWERLGLRKDRAGSSAVFATHAAAEKHTLTAAAMTDCSAERQLRTASSIPTCMVLPTITNSPQSRLEPVSRIEVLSDVLAQMVPASLLPADEQRAQLRCTSALLRQCTAYRLYAGRDLYRDPGLLASLLHGAAATA